MSVYSELLDSVVKGKRFKVDLIEKSLWIDRKQIIRKGEIICGKDIGKELINKWDLYSNFGGSSLDHNPWDWINVLYSEYKHSAPEKHSDNSSYFKALSVDDLSDADLAYGHNRKYSQAMLEGYILFGSLVGWIKWEHGNHWFYQGEDKDLVVLKNWIE